MKQEGSSKFEDLDRELQIAWDLYGTNAFDNYTGCSDTIVVNLAIRYQKIEKQWRQ